MELIKRISFGLFALYALGLLSLPMLWWGFGENHWPLILLRYLPGGLSLLPIPLFLLLVRERKVVIAGICLSVFCLFVGMDLKLPFRSESGGDMKIVSYNIQAGLKGPSKLGEFLKEGKFDLIGLQEARIPVREPRVDPVPTLGQFLPDYQVARGGIRGELVVFSKYPVVSSEERDLGGLSKALDVRVNVDGRPLRILNVHLMTGDPLKKLPKGSRIFARLRMTAKTRHIQFGALNELLEEDIPTVLLGDFNTPPNSVGTKLLSKTLVDSFAAVGAGFGNTYKAKLPVWRIDYVWLSKGLIPHTAGVGFSKLSDHRPLVVRVGWSD